MIDPHEDQTQAAVKEARQNVGRALGLDDDRPTRGTSALFEQLWTTYGTAPRCPHLVARPIQPSYLPLPMAVWGCRECVAGWAAMRPRFDPIEESTCDLCRRYVRSLTTTIVRQDLWVVVLHTCSRCERTARAKGARLVHMDMP